MMSEPDAWDDEDFEPQAQNTAPAKTDKWEGEDEDDDVKDAWDQEEKKSDQPAAVQMKKKKPLKERLAEREAKAKAELEAKRKQEEDKRDMTPAQLVAEKLKHRKRQEEADLKLAKEAFGITDDPEGGIDACAPVTKNEFETFEHLLKEKITKYQTSAHYVNFLETLFRDVTLELEVEDLKKLGTTLNTLCNEKVKVQKGKTKKKKGTKLMVSKEATENLESYDYVEEYDDFL